MAPRPPRPQGWVFFDDNYFCLLPGEEWTLTATWSEVPESERRLEVSAWNAGVLMLDGDAASLKG